MPASSGKGQALPVCWLLVLSVPLFVLQPPTSLAAEASFEAPFEASFDDDLFGDTSLFEPEERSRFDDFTFKLSHQVFAQANSHSVSLPGTAVERRNEATIENNRVALHLRYQNPFASGWIMQASGQAKVYGPGDYEFRANGDSVDTEFRLNEFFLQRSSNNHSLKLGRQTIVWGETVGNSVLDVINTSEFRDLSVIDIEDARLNQWMLVWDYYSGRNSLSTFVNLYPEFNPPPVRGSPLFLEPPFNLTEPKRDKTLFEIGTRWRTSFEGSDVALMAAYLYDNQPRYRAPPNNMGDAVALEDGYLLLGASANRAVGRLLLKLDLAYSRGLDVDVLQMTPNLIEPPEIFSRSVDRLGTSFGFEYAIDSNQQFSLGIMAEKILNLRDGLGIGQTVMREEVNKNGLIRYSNSLMNSDLILSATVQSSLNDDFMLASLAVDYMISNNWSLMTQLISTGAADDAPTATLDEDLRIGATITYSF